MRRERKGAAVSVVVAPDHRRQPRAEKAAVLRYNAPIPDVGTSIACGFTARLFLSSVFCRSQFPFAQIDNYIVLQQLLQFIQSVERLDGGHCFHAECLDALPDLLGNGVCQRELPHGQGVLHRLD